MAIVVDSDNVQYNNEYIEAKYEYQLTKVEKIDTRIKVRLI